MVDQFIMDRALARTEEIDRLFPAPQESQVVAPVKKPQVHKPTREQPKTETKEAKEPKESIHYGFVGRAVDEPIFHATMDIFGVDPEYVSQVDRNTLQEIVELTAERLRTVDEQKILSFISKESRKYQGPYSFRALRRMLALSL